jgi:L,D-peptidoglycan transpeptidase YkuD (ErfK/YbiS/YcfS/YnhG family)
MDLLVDHRGLARWGGRLMLCAFGRAGIVDHKREGDHATPAGAFVMRRVLYRPDRLEQPQTRLPVARLTPSDGWCDAPSDPDYNQPVRLPHRSSAEPLWRADGLYDLVVVLGCNDAPVVPDRGSAIFLHLAALGFAATEGCVALGRRNLLGVLAEADSASRVVIGVAGIHDK